MSPFDRIAQLNTRVSSLEDENAVLRSQLEDARKQAAHDSQIIAKLAKDKCLLGLVLEDSEFLLRIIGINWREAQIMAESCKRSAANARETLSNHA